MPTSPEAGSVVERQEAERTARRIVAKAERGIGHYPGRLQQLNLAREFLALHAPDSAEER